MRITTYFVNTEYNYPEDDQVYFLKKNFFIKDLSEINNYIQSLNAHILNSELSVFYCQVQIYDKKNNKSKYHKFESQTKLMTRFGEYLKRHTLFSKLLSARLDFAYRDNSKDTLNQPIHKITQSQRHLEEISIVKYNLKIQKTNCATILTKI